MCWHGWHTRRCCQVIKRKQSFLYIRLQFIYSPGRQTWSLLFFQDVCHVLLCAIRSFAFGTFGPKVVCRVRRTKLKEAGNKNIVSGEKYCVGTWTEVQICPACEIFLHPSCGSVGTKVSFHLAATPLPLSNIISYHNLHVTTFWSIAQRNVLIEHRQEIINVRSKLKVWG